MTFYEEFVETAREMLEEFGQPITITQYGVAVENVDSGIVTIPEFVTTTEVGVLLDYDYRSFGSSLEGRSSVGKIDKRLLMSAGVVVQPNDSVNVDGLVYKIINIKLIRPAAVSILYDLWIQQ